MTLVNPDLMKEIKKYSTKDFNVSACFNCGNCTAICPLSDEKYQFPRTLIRYAQIGMKEKILGSDLMWLCSYCNDCSDTCPRDAEPGEFVMATRRWAMGQYEVTRISQLLHKTRFGGFVAMGVIFIFTLFLLNIFTTPANIPNDRPIRLFDLVSKEIVEIVGIGLAGIVITIMGLSVLNMYRLISKEYNISLSNGITIAYETRKEDKKLNTAYHLIFSPFIMIKQAFVVVIKEVFGQYRQLECAMPPHKPEFKSQFIRNRWIMHLLILWGFFGLGIATTLNMFLKPDSNTLVPITHPIRVLGIISGIFLMIGITIAFWNRLKKRSRYASHSLACDWVLLSNLFLVGLTGFLITISFYLTPLPPLWSYWFFVVHLIVVIELILLAPFGKFAHVWYRSFALWIHYGIQARQNKLVKDIRRAQAREKAKTKAIKTV